MPERIQLRRTKGWRIPDNTVIVDRRSRWGNWYVVSTIGELYDGELRAKLPDPKAFVVYTIDKWGHRTGSMWGGFAGRRDAVAFAVEMHSRALLGTRADLDGIRSHRYWLAELRGRNLACWCPVDQPCHADVLLELANMPVAGAPAVQVLDEDDGAAL